MLPPFLNVSSVSKSFRKKDVLKCVDIHIRAGEHIALVGNNGQGKTTLIKIVLGLLNADVGSIAIMGEDVTHHRCAKHKQLLGYLPETVAFYPNLTGRETLRYCARLKCVPTSKVEVVLAIVGMQAAANERIKTYSKGMKQRIGLAQALLGDPKMLLLDEPTNGLDPSAIHEFYVVLQQLKEQGVAVIMASHLLAEVEPHVDKLAVLRDGVIEHFGSVPELVKQSKLPGRIQFRVRSGAHKRLMDELRLLSSQVVYDSGNRVYILPCTEENKLLLLSKVLAYSDQVTDLIVTEPGLEALFLSLVASDECQKGGSVS